MMVWSRDKSVPFPSVWGRFKGRRPMPDGKIPSFRVQDVTPELNERVVQFMCDHFARDEPMCKGSDLISDKSSVEEFREMWVKCLESRIALVCLLEDEDGEVALDKETNEPVIVGVNMTTHSNRHDNDKLQMGPICARILGVVMMVSDISQVFDKYGVDDIMTAYGLSVDKKYRGQNIGLEILKARVPLCKAVGLKVTGTAFTAITSQILADRCGFKLLSQISYKDLAEKHEYIFSDLDTEYVKYMALAIE